MARIMTLNRWHRLLTWIDTHAEGMLAAAGMSAALAAASISASDLDLQMARDADETRNNSY